MANKLIYPFINPLQFFSTAPGIDARYNSKDFEDFEFPDTIPPWDQYVEFQQLWQKNDTIALQLQTNVGPVNWILKKYCDDEVVDTVQLDQKQESDNEPGLFIYELSAPLSGYDEDDYYAVLEFGSPVTFSLRTGRLRLRTLQENSLLVEYKHFENREDMVFETGIFPSVRIAATKKYLGPKQKATMYEDQVLNASALRSQKFRAWKLFIGETFGIPDYFADMIGGIVGCSDLLIDGKKYTVSEGAEMEASEIENYPMRGWAIELREKFTRGSRHYENDDPINANVAVMINVDSKGFGNSNTGSQTAIIDVI